MPCCLFVSLSNPLFSCDRKSRLLGRQVGRGRSRSWSSPWTALILLRMALWTLPTLWVQQFRHKNAYCPFYRVQQLSDTHNTLCQTLHQFCPGLCTNPCCVWLAFFSVHLQEQFLQERIKVNGKAGNLGGGVVSIERSKSKIAVNSEVPFSKRYKTPCSNYMVMLLNSSYQTFSTLHHAYPYTYINAYLDASLLADFYRACQ